MTGGTYLMIAHTQQGGGWGLSPPPVLAAAGARTRRRAGFDDAGASSSSELTDESESSPTTPGPARITRSYFFTCASVLVLRCPSSSPSVACRSDEPPGGRCPPCAPPAGVGSMRTALRGRARGAGLEIIASKSSPPRPGGRGCGRPLGGCGCGRSAMGRALPDKGGHGPVSCAAMVEW